MLSTSGRLIIGTVVSFFTGLGVMGLSISDAQYLTGSIDSVVGGVIAIISLVGFTEHLMAKHQAEKQAVTITGVTTAQA